MDRGAPPNLALTPPDKVCPGCEVRTRTFEERCPHCGRAFDRKPPWQVALIATGAVLFTLAGCAALGAAGLFLGGRELEKHSITRQQYDAVPLGATEDRVEARFGDPFERDSGCLLYDEKDKSILAGDVFELCFEDGRLTSKDSY